MQITLNDLVNKHSTLNVANFNRNFDNFVHSVKSMIDRYAPLKKQSRRQQRLKSKPWITKGLFTSIQNKRRMFKTYYLSHVSTKQQFFKKYFNLLNRVKLLSRKMFYRVKLSSQLMIHSKRGKPCKIY